MKFFTPKIKSATFLFVILNVFLYVFIIGFNDRVPFNKSNYIYNFHHYIPDQKMLGNKFNLINSLAQSDAQWYLKIADNGYPKNPKYETAGKDINSGLSYAFFPLYPLCVRTINYLFHSVELSAFLFANFMLIVNFLSLIYVIKFFKSEQIAIKTAFLLFLFPFSIFYRSYFTEGLFLFFLIWFSYCFIKKNLVLSGLMLGLLSITRGSGVLLFIPYVYYLYEGLRKKETSITKAIVSISFSFVPAALWSLFSYMRTGDPLFFMKVRSSWTHGNNPIDQFIINTNTVLDFSNQSIHSFHSSKIDIFIILATLALLLLSYGRIKMKLWLIAFCLFLTPLIFNDTMSYARMQIVSFPLFMYLSVILKGKYYLIVAGLFALGLFLVSLYFINWYWIG